MSIFKNFQKDRKIGKTPFNMSFQNILTANFGGLTPEAVYEVLPDDTFKVGINCLTKVEPMPAPAFTRIKQNHYGFFVPNQQIWKHWNDFVSNGTSYADTYGNNSNTQSIDNLWREPQIPASYLQFIGKMANGWAIPIWTMNSFPGALLLAVAKWISSRPGYDDSEPNLIGLIRINLMRNSTKCNLPLLQILMYYANKIGILPDWILTDIPYMEMSLDDDIVNYTSSLTTYEFMLQHCKFEYGCDVVTAYRFREWCANLTGTLLRTNLKKTCDTEKLEKTEEFHSGYSENNGFNSTLLGIRCFCDDISNDVSIKHAPFALQKMSYCSSETNNRPINYFVFRRNLYEDSVVPKKSSFSFLDDESRTVITNYDRRVRNCGYFWSTDIHTSESTISGVEVHGSLAVFLNGVSINPRPSSTEQYDFFSVLGLDLDTAVSQEVFLTLHNFKNTYNEIICDMTNPGTDNVPIIGSPETYTHYSDTSNAVAVSESLNNINPFHLMNETYGNNQFADLIRQGYYVRRFKDNYFDVDLPLMYNSDINFIDNWTTCTQYDGESVRIYFTFESYNLGYDAFSFFIYLCKSSCKLLDYFNLPLEGLVSRSFNAYAGEFFIALPFMAYSKIWNDYFRNKVTSTAELDFRETNSNICFDMSSWYFLYKDFENGGEHLGIKKYPEWVQTILSNGFEQTSMLNGWCIPFNCAPKNAMDTVSIDLGNDQVVKLSDFNHFHDIRLNSYWSAFSVLTGWQLQELAMLQIINYYDVKNRNIYGILADKLYLPSYYNGLLHYKYQNFNKDYFGSALLDPMSGANQEYIGDTVNSLINAEAKQGFWNRLAQNRSLSQFWKRVFGVNLSHSDTDKPLMLGSSHTDVNIGEVVQLSQTDTTPQGQRSGLGSSHDKKGLFKHTFNEHGFIIILVSHTLELQYMQGLEKMWSPKESFLDLPFVDFVGLGNQSISQKELNFTTKPKVYPATTAPSGLPDDSEFRYAQEISYDLLNKVNYAYPSTPKLLSGRSYLNAHSQTVNLNLANGSGYNLNDIFGYIPRYSTYKFKFDQCHGEFRNDLMFWHSFRKFFTQPILCHEFVNWEFMAENDELMRMFFVVDETTDKFKLDTFINCTAIRPLPYVCTPKTSI